jgi:hypothetical protein
VLWPAPLSFKNFLSSSAAPIIIRPEELAVNLLRPYQVFQLFEARKRPVFKDIFRHVDPLEKIVKLLRPPSHVPATSEPGQMFASCLCCTKQKWPPKKDGHSFVGKLFNRLTY